MFLLTSIFSRKAYFVEVSSFSRSGFVALIAFRAQGVWKGGGRSEGRGSFGAYGEILTKYVVDIG